ncbi:hypothetical protein Q5P01_002911 [Channa striata]|uniref:Fibrinogen alpha/beta/gamma chain coiled coil domain-containing protein n=1 Tax=Channa striata TaxID=64152 RepID=A0AA88P1T2_CHASR|nr:hypothetical protein Q5P01_002911 [Channa striata]
MALCSDDDWVSKCPSGCRLQGLISQMESKVERKLWKVCKTAKMYEDAADISMMATKTFTTITGELYCILPPGSVMKFVDHAEALSRNLTSVRKRSSRLALKLKELRSKVQKQFEDLYRTEVDIDMKLRACRGACKSVLPFKVSHSSYQILQSEIEQMDKTLNQRSNVAVPPQKLPHIKVQSMDGGAAPSIEQKTAPTFQLLAQFEDIGQNQLVLEEVDLEEELE